MNTRVVFLGGIFLESRLSEIETNSIGVVQNAADVLQKAFLTGISTVFPSALTLVNLPFINSHPRGYRGLYFPEGSDSEFANFHVIQKGWLNLEVARLFFRLTAAYRGLRNALRDQGGVVLLYSAHLPFIGAAILHAKVTRRTKTCLILPDFPEFMGEGGILYRVVKGVESRLFYFLAKYIDYFVVLTPFMADRLGLDKSRFCVIEGMTYVDAARQRSSFHIPDGPNRVFLYTGTLAARYGILDLLNAFSQTEGSNIELRICGEGDSRTVVEKFCARDKRITYYGQVPRQRALELQQQAHVLVNPRPPHGEYTRYSFPSKTIEYLAAGRPIVMHRLPGVPLDYFPYIIAPDTADVAGLSGAFKRAADMSLESLKEMGLKGQEFVLSEKSPEKQCMKILRMLQAT